MSFDKMSLDEVKEILKGIYQRRKDAAEYAVSIWEVDKRSTSKRNYMRDTSEDLMDLIYICNEIGLEECDLGGQKKGRK